MDIFIIVVLSGVFFFPLSDNCLVLSSGLFIALFSLSCGSRFLLLLLSSLLTQCWTFCFFFIWEAEGAPICWFTPRLPHRPGLGEAKPSARDSVGVSPVGGGPSHRCCCRALPGLAVGQSGGRSCCLPYCLPLETLVFSVGRPLSYLHLRPNYK